MVEKTFREIEHAAWSASAGEYDDLFGPIASQAIGPILNGLGYLKGKRLLDVACGTGHLVAAASIRGAVSEGVDFARPMIDIARATYPRAAFDVADAVDLPYEDESFDAVTCVFGLLHMEHPQAVFDEVFRVLKPGGKYAFTLWYGAAEGNEFKRIIQAVLNKHAADLHALPVQWTQLRDADPQICAEMALQSGFVEPVFQRLPIVWQAPSADEHLGVVEKISVRTRMIIDCQPPAVRRRIYKQVRAEIEARRSNGRIDLAWPALLTIVCKPGEQETA